MRISVVRDLVTLARAQRIYAAVRQFGAEVASNAQHDVSFRAPMIGGVVRGVFDHSHAQGAEVSRAPYGNASLARMLGWLDILPIGDAERDSHQFH